MIYITLGSIQNRLTIINQNKKNISYRVSLINDSKNCNYEIIKRVHDTYVKRPCGLQKNSGENEQKNI
jgi:hypothetical protein